MLREMLMHKVSHPLYLLSVTYQAALFRCWIRHRRRAREGH